MKRRGGPFCVVCKKNPIDGAVLCKSCRASASKSVRGWKDRCGDIDISDLICWVAREVRAADDVLRDAESRLGRNP